MTRSSLAWLTFFATRIFAITTDIFLIAFAYISAFALRLDFATPIWGWRATAKSLVIVSVVHFFCLLFCGSYKLAWRRTKPRDALRVAVAMILSAIILMGLRVLLPSVAFAHIRPPYSVTVISFFLSTFLLISARFIWLFLWTSQQKPIDLLSREIRAFDNSTAARFLSGRVVAITGAGGSIGSELVRQVVNAGASKIIMIERGENALYEIDRSLRARGVSNAVPLMCDINDRDKMEEIFATYSPSIVLHAAAYKHVPMVEANPEEGKRNNTEATRELAKTAKKFGVERFVLISTDKAVNPSSVMGRTKREAEKAIMALNDNSSTSFCAVRFGNVLGSSGSVVPLFREQIAAGGPVTITHPEMARYFMTIEEAVSLVLQAASRDERAIYTLDMGKSVKILDLAEGLITQAGFRPYVDIPIIFTGIRPGEKLFEEIDVSEKSAYKTDMAKIYINKFDEGEEK